jgi:saccharopine dehydrogenase-like NADP-dependent oxidoreductase
MPSLLRRLTFSAPVVRPFAIMALLGVTSLISPVTAARADPADHAPIELQQSSSRQAGSEAARSKAETVEQRISNLHAALKISREQESEWNAVAQAMRENASIMQKLVADRKAQAPRGMSAVEDLKSYERFTQAHADGLKNLISAFEILYSSMPAAQQKIADQVFEKFGRKGARSHG